MKVFKNGYFYVFLFACCLTLFLFVNCNPEDQKSLESTFNNQAGFDNLASSRSDNPPNMIHIVRQVADRHPEVLRSSCREGQENHVFIGLVIEELRKTSQRWGFNCKRGNCDTLSIDAIAYYRGTGNSSQSSDVAIFDIMANCHSGNPRAAWLDQTEATREAGSIGRFLYPHPDSNLLSSFSSNDDNDISDFAWSKVTFLNGHDISGWSETSRINSVSVSDNGICIDHSKDGQWPARPLDAIRVEANHWLIVKIDGRYYAATYEWIRAGGQRCKLGGGLNKIYHELGTDQIRRPPLDSSWVPEGGDVIGFMASGLARNNIDPNVRERTNIVWYRLPSVDGSISGGQVETDGSGSSGTPTETVTVIEGQCSPQPNTCSAGDFHSHPEDTATEVRWTCRNRPHVLYNGKIEKRCTAPAPRSAPRTTTQPAVNVIEGQCGSQPNTCSAGDFHSHPKDAITEIRWTCRNRPHVLYNGKIEKRCTTPRTVGNCKGPHYKVVNRRCLPSCGALAHANSIGPQDHQLQPGQCSAGWTRIGDSHEEAEQGGVVCCRKTL